MQQSRYEVSPTGAFDSLVTAEPIRIREPRKHIDDIKAAVAGHLDWFSRRQLNGEIGLDPPAKFEDNRCRHNDAPTTVGASV